MVCIAAFMILFLLAFLAFLIKHLEKNIGQYSKKPGTVFLRRFVCKNVTPTLKMMLKILS